VGLRIRVVLYYGCIFSLVSFPKTSSWNYGLKPMLKHIEAWRADDICAARRIWVESGLRNLQEYIYSDYSRLHLRCKVGAWCAD
jgi:hypothetical protein